MPASTRSVLHCRVHICLYLQRQSYLNASSIQQGVMLANCDLGWIPIVWLSLFSFMKICTALILTGVEQFELQINSFLVFLKLLCS